MQETLEMETLGQQIVKAAKLAVAMHITEELEGAGTEMESDLRRTHTWPPAVSRN